MLSSISLEQAYTWPQLYPQNNILYYLSKILDHVSFEMNLFLPTHRLLDQHLTCLKKLVAEIHPTANLTDKHLTQPSMDSWLSNNKAILKSIIFYIYYILTVTIIKYYHYIPMLSIYALNSVKFISETFLESGLTGRAHTRVRTILSGGRN